MKVAVVQQQVHRNQRLAAAKQALSHYVDHKDVKELLATIVAFAASQAGGRHHVLRPWVCSEFTTI